MKELQRRKARQPRGNNNTAPIARTLMDIGRFITNGKRLPPFIAGRPFFREREVLRQSSFGGRPAVVLLSVLDPLLAVVAFSTGHVSGL